MDSDDEEDEWTPSQDSAGRFFAFAIPLILVSVAVTVGIAIWTSPSDQLTGFEYAAWIGFPIVVFLVFVIQNSIEGCVILVMLGVVIGIGSRFLPPHLFLPAISALIAPWFLTRIHRRFCDNKPWIE